MFPRDTRSAGIAIIGNNITSLCVIMVITNPSTQSFQEQDRQGKELGTGKFRSHTDLGVPKDTLVGFGSVTTKEKMEVVYCGSFVSLSSKCVFVCNVGWMKYCSPIKIGRAHV